MLTFRRLAVAAVILGLSGPALAIDIVIDDPRWLELSDTQRADIEKNLKEAKGIGAEDKLVYKGKSGKTVAQENPTPAAMRSATAAVGRAACRFYSSWQLSNCNSDSDRKSCRSKEKARYASVKSKCE
jgi:hypothetical protein